MASLRGPVWRNPGEKNKICCGDVMIATKKGKTFHEILLCVFMNYDFVNIKDISLYKWLAASEIYDAEKSVCSFNLHDKLLKLCAIHSNQARLERYAKLTS